MFGKFSFRASENESDPSRIASGLDETVVTYVLNRTPTATELGDSNDCLSYYAINGEIAVISKTTLIPSSVFGAPNSCKTTVIHFAPDDLAQFDTNPGLLAYTLVSSGFFADLGDSETAMNALSSLPAFIFDTEIWKQAFDCSMLNQVSRAIDIHNQVVVACEANPYKLISTLYADTENRKRWDRSFAFGASNPIAGPFSLQVFRKFNVNTQSFLMDNQIRYFEIGVENAVTA